MQSFATVAFTLGIHFLFHDAEKSPDGGQIRREMCYNSILEGDTLSPEAEARCKETLSEIVR